MSETESLRAIREVRRKHCEEEKRLGRAEFRRRQRERVREFLKGKRISFVPSAEPKK